jgi:hypothetical protein
MRDRLAALCLAGALLVAPRPGVAADLEIQGCNQLQWGEVGEREAVGDIGDTVRVAVTVNASAPISALQLNLDVPPDVLSYVRTERGNLTSAWFALGGHWFPDSSRVRIIGVDDTGIAAGSIGRLAVVVFVVTAAGTGAFGTSGLQAGLLNYISCEDAHDTSHIPQTEWGSIKALYRP